MATITLTELLGTDNIALSRTDINQNFQTLENSVNTLETFLNTTPAGGELSVGNFIINSTVFTDVLSTNNASALIQGGLTVNCLGTTGFTVATTATVGTDLTVNNKLLVDGSGASAAITIGASGNVPITLADIVLIDTQVATATATAAAVETLLLAGTGIFEVDVTNLRKVLLDYTALPAVSDPTSANYIRITGTLVDGQRVVFGIHDVANPAAVANIYFDNTGFHAKYNAITPTPTPYNSLAAATAAAIGFGGATTEEFTRQWVELIYTSSGWEVYQSHPSVLGL